MKNRDILIDAGCYARENPNYTPTSIKNSDGTITTETHCNEAVSYIATRMGCMDFAGRLANEICDFLSANTENWTLTPLEKAQFLASQGSLVIAAEKGDPHGHVCVIMPGIAKVSGRWNTLAPMVVNIGREVFIGKGLNYAFQEIPKLYVWRSSL